MIALLSQLRSRQSNNDQPNENGQAAAGLPAVHLDIAVVGHYVNSRESMSEEFKKFLSKYPDWAHVTAWASTFKAWKF